MVSEHFRSISKCLFDFLVLYGQHQKLLLNWLLINSHRFWLYRDIQSFHRILIFNWVFYILSAFLHFSVFYLSHLLINFLAVFRAQRRLNGQTYIFGINATLPSSQHRWFHIKIFDYIALLKVSLKSFPTQKSTVYCKYHWAWRNSGSNVSSQQLSSNQWVCDLVVSGRDYLAGLNHLGSG